MTDKTYRGRPLYESPDGKFTTIDADVFAAWQADQERQQALAEKMKRRAIKPAESDPADATNDPDENGADPERVADGRRDGDLHRGGHGEPEPVRPHGQGNRGRPKQRRKRQDGDDQ
jgi:hypothetical protein